MHPFPLFQKLDQCNNILLAGAGGGYDIFCGLPLYFHLMSQGKKVQLANLSFSPVHAMDGERLTPSVLKVTQHTEEASSYFPEKHLCAFLSNHFQQDISIQCFTRSGVPQIAAAYQALQDRDRYDSVILIDGGTDSLMRGDEVGLGTPQEDIASLFAVNQLELDHRYLVCLGFGIDTFHGVNHFQFLESVAALAAAGGFLGTFSVIQEMEEAQLYRAACQHTFERMSHHPSIVNSSILSAIEGKYGDIHSTKRTEGSRLWINPLMAMYWAFEVSAVSDRCLYLDTIANASSFTELTLAIERFRNELSTIRGWDEIPV